MKRLWYGLAAFILVIFASLLWLRRGEFMDVLSAFGRPSEAPQPAVAWTTAPEMPSGDLAPGSNRLRHIISRLIDPNAIPYEAILRFKTDADFEDFLKNNGKLRLLGSIPSLRAARVGYENIDDLNDIPENADTSPNFLVQLPAPPDPQGPGIQDGAVPFGSSAMEWLGIQDNETWGEGRQIAVIDTGILEHPTFGEVSVSNTQDFVADGENASAVDATIIEVNGHGTAVASVAAGQLDAAPGVAPAAEILSYRVADANGNSDSFTLAEGILAAAEAGADVINISLGSAGDSNVVEEAVETAIASGSTIVAAAGNNGVPGLTYPAAYEGVISVGAVDAAGQHLDFSNTADDLSVSAPGYAVPAAWPDEQVIQFTGTSASAPFVSGSIAAIMSWDPSITGQQAYDLLLAHSNEAGAPGIDPIYGEGILNVGRVVDAGTSGIYDVAVASHFYAGDIQDNGREILQVVAENRGTEIIYGSTLKVDSPVGEQTFTLGAMKPGEVVSREVIVDVRHAELQGSADYATSLTLPGSQTDNNPADNNLSSSFLPPVAAEGE
ncbi:MAG: S8 family serine peptidase [Verrucomicrobiaceae bacterium]|nr:S8 family serine peptidase [Verrucomicrobiaceae bacterium]